MKVVITDIPKTEMGFAIGLNLKTIGFISFSPSAEELEKMENGQREFEVPDSRISR